MSRKQPPRGLFLALANMLMTWGHRQGKHTRPNPLCVLCWFRRLA